MEQIHNLGKNLAVAVAMRLGTAGAAWLIAQGLPPDTAGQLETVAGIVVGLLYDYLMTLIIKKESI